MSYAAAVNESVWKQTGSQLLADHLPPATVPESWQELWREIFRTQALRSMSQHSTPVAMSFAIDTLPMVEMMSNSNTANMLAVLEQLFGDSATTLAKMLRVSRQMVYHYREGMEPSLENKRRLQVLASLAGESESLGRQRVERLLKAEQPEGKTLLDFLSVEQLDMAVLRRLLWRNSPSSDREVRGRLAAVLVEQENSKARSDVMRKRHSEGKPIYVGDPDAPGKLIQIQADGIRVRGKMVKRRFVPDE